MCCERLDRPPARQRGVGLTVIGGMMGLKERVVEILFGGVLERRVASAVKAVDDRWWSQVAGAVGPHDLDWHERQTALKDALQAWRENPLAFRIVSLTTDYVVGSGIRILSGVPWVQDGWTYECTAGATSWPDPGSCSWY